MEKLNTKLAALAENHPDFKEPYFCGHKEYKSADHISGYSFPLTPVYLMRWMVYTATQDIGYKFYKKILKDMGDLQAL